MKKIILAVAVAASMTTGVFAGEDFNLNSLSGSDLKAAAVPGVEVSAPASIELAGFNKSPNLAPGLDMTLKLTFASLNKRLAEMFAKVSAGPEAPAQLQVIDPLAPVLSRLGDLVVLTNVTVDYKGVDIEPTVQIRPYFEGNNRLALQFTKVEADVAFGPKAAGLPQLDKNEIMALVAEKLTTGVLDAMNKAFASNKVALKAENVIAFTYNKADWTLRAVISPDFVAPLLPGLIKNINLASFTFDDSGFALGVQTGVAINQLQGYNLALSDGLLTAFLLQYTSGSDFNLTPEGYEGGVKFRADGRMELAGKIYAREMFLKPNVYFVVTMLPKLTARNVMTVKIEKVEVEKAYGIGVPGFLNNWLQGTIISKVVDTVANDPKLKKAVKARKLSDDTLEFNLDKAAFLPSFAEGAVINNLRVKTGLLYLAFDL